MDRTDVAELLLAQQPRPRPARTYLAGGLAALATIAGPANLAGGSSDSLSNVPAGAAEAPGYDRPIPTTVPGVVLVPPLVIEQDSAGTVTVVAPPAESGPTCWPTVKAYLDAWTATGVQPEAPCFDVYEPAPPGSPGTVPMVREPEWDA